MHIYVIGLIQEIEDIFRPVGYTLASEFQMITTDDKEGICWEKSHRLFYILFTILRIQVGLREFPSIIPKLYPYCLGVCEQPAIFFMDVSEILGMRGK
jgi:hypothetical protein